MNSFYIQSFLSGLSGGLSSCLLGLFLLGSNLLGLLLGNGLLLS